MKTIESKSFVLAALFFLILVFPVRAEPPLSNTEGFMGYKWGTHVNSVKNIRKVGSYYDKSIQVYQAQDTKEAYATQWKLLFWNDLFMAAKLWVKGNRLTGLWERVRNDLGTTFGKPADTFDSDHYKRASWDSQQTYAEVEYGSATWVSSFMGSKEIYDKWVQTDKAKDENKNLTCNYSRFGYGSFSKYCVDRSTIEKLSDGIVQADVYSVSLVEDSIASKITVEFNCSARTRRFKGSVYYKNDQIDERRKRSTGKEGADWEPAKGVYRDVCSFLCK